MRRVLQRTNTKINTQNNNGLTPLHYCLRDWEPTRSYEYHKEAAIVLITYGASASIKDKYGKTPLDIYEGNRCRGYEETTRNEKKRELKELLEKLSTPSEILARGPDAVKAFKDALKNGEITVVNSRLMFLGQEGSGKTSCVKAMLGKEFNKDEPSTDGIVRTTVFQTVGEDYSKWEEQKDIDECEQTKQILEHSIAVDVAKKMEQPKTEQNKYKNSSDQQNKYKNLSSPGSVVSTSAAEDEQPESEISKGKPVAQDTTEVSTNQLILRKKVFETMVNKSSGPMDLTCIWDYAGQLDYYITHRFFLTDRTSYAVVFSLLDALDKLAKSRDPKNGFLEMTNLQSILFWIRSIFEHAVLLHGSQSKNVISGMIASPPISLIGTHADLLTGSDAEKKKKVDDIFDSIFKAIEGEPYVCHVDRERYAVDNTTALDKGIQTLKKNVGGYLKTMARTVPIKWVEFQIMVQEAGKTTLRMSLEKIIKLAVECGINDENVIHVLNYFNDLGIILYSPTNEKLKNTVITNIQMLIGIFMKIITVVKPGDSDKVPVMIKHWHKLDNEGILVEPLARYLWRNELKSTASEDGDGVIFEDFIELMKKFGLLLEKNASEDGTRLFVVPSRMKMKTDNRLDIKKDDEQTVSIYVTPKDFLPDAVYNILVVRFVNWSQDKGCRANPKLFQNQSTIRFGNKHYLKLGRISIDSKPSLKLEISRMIDTNADGTDRPACKPHPGVCNEVLNVLKQNLDEVYPSKQDVGYLLKILCPCSLEHFQELDDCLDNEYIDCDKTGAFKAIPTANIQKLFLADIQHAPHPPSATNTPHSSSASDMPNPSLSPDTPPPASATATPDTPTSDTSFRTACSALSDKELKELKSVVSQWYDSNKSVPLLKVLFRDKVDIYELSSETRTMDLLNILFARGRLSSQNLGILCDTISVTKQFGLLSRIREKLPSFPDVKEGSTSGSFTPYRQKLMKFGMVLTPANVTQIDQLYNTPPKKYTDGWSMISDLEDQQIISEGNMEEFTDSLKMLKLSLALKALTEV